MLKKQILEELNVNTNTKKKQSDGFDPDYHPSAFNFKDLLDDISPSFDTDLNPSFLHSSDSDTLISPIIESKETQKVLEQEKVEKLFDIDHIPNDIVFQMMDFLPLNDILSIRQVSKKFSNFFGVTKATKNQEFKPKRDDQNDEYLTFNLNKKLNNVVMFEVRCTSHDQGWATGGGSHTWADLVLKCKDTEKEILRKRIFTNVRAKSEWKTHQPENFGNSDLFEKLEKADSISIFLRSSYPGWRCFAKNASFIIITKTFE
eukprot:gene9021-1120_t